MDSKKILEKLFAIASKQQKIIEKLAQVAPPAQDFSTAAPNTREAQTILAALPPAVRPAVAILEVHGNDVKVRFQPGKSSDAAFQAIQQTVTSLQQQNKLSGSQYTVSEA